VRLATPLFVLLTVLAACGDRRPTTVLLVTIDTLRADHTSAFGYDLDTTPNLTALAARGTAFEFCWSQHVETGPSIASMMTSRYPREIGVRANGDILPEEFPTLAAIFGNAGYETAGFVSTYLLKPHASGLDRGFDHYDARMNAANLGHENFERRAADSVDRALLWLAKTEGRRRFVWVHLYDPHGKYDPPDEGRRFLRDRGRPDLRPEQIVAYQRYGDELDPDDYVARYDGEIFEADLALGRLIAAVGEDALIVVTADHGESLGEDDYWFRHGSLLNRASLHVPLVIAGGGVTAGIRERILARNLDVAPTILDVAGLDPLEDARGRSLVRSHATPSASFAEARRGGGVTDRTGIDTSYKVSVTMSSLHHVFRPGVVEESPHPALTMWMERTGDRLVDGRKPADVDDALRGLGYIR